MAKNVTKRYRPPLKQVALEDLEWLRSFNEAEKAEGEAPVKFEDVVDEVPDRLVKLFKLSGGDHHDPKHWLFLLILFAGLLFDPTNVGGRPRKFHRPSKKTLEKDFLKIASKNSSQSASVVFGRMIEHHSRYKNISLSTLKNAFKASGLSTANLLVRAKRSSAAKRPASQKRGRQVVAR